MWRLNCEVSAEDVMAIPTTLDDSFATELYIWLIGKIQSQPHATGILLNEIPA